MKMIVQTKKEDNLYLPKIVFRPTGILAETFLKGKQIDVYAEHRRIAFTRCVKATRNY